MKTRFVLVCCLFAPALFLRAQDNGVRIHEEQETFPTYDEGAPDPNPQFDAFYRNVFPNYPYTIRTPINKNRALVSWRVIVLENEYLSCRVLPDLGGHLHGCTDRITGQEVFYSNPAIRRTGDSVRGEFFATGIETSFPFAHSRVTGSPVDFGWSMSGGIGRVVVGDTDRTTGMSWRVEFILRPGSDVLEQRGIIYNGSPARRGYQWWVNAEVERNDPHTRVIFPTHWMLPHDSATMTPWPISAKGVDLSDIANHNDQVGLFAHLSHEPWMALYKPKFRSGLAHYADPNKIAGKKVWIFSNHDTTFAQTLTENFNIFTEMQAGELETQPEFAFLLPEQSKTFEHYWIPFHDLGGVSRATRDAVLNLSRNGRAVIVELHATHVIKAAKLRLSESGKVVWEGPVDLDPRTKFAQTVEAAKLIVDLSNSTGAVLLHHVENEFDAAPFDPNARNPEPVAPADNSDKEEAALARGTYNEQREQLAFAWGDYERALKLAPGSVKLKTAAGRVAIALNRYDDALRLLKDVAQSNGEAAYYYGVGLANTPSHAAEARSALTNAEKDPNYSAAAKVQLAMLAAREQGTADAQKTIQELAAKPAAPGRVGALETALLRRSGKAPEAKTRARFWLEKDPSNDMLRLERVWNGGEDDSSLWRHLGANPERVVALADQYVQIGAYDDALKLLDRLYPDSPANQKEPSWVLPQNYPIVAYYRGYCRMKLGQDPKPDFLTASMLSSLYGFPHREMEYSVLEAALSQNAKDATAHNLLGDLYFDSFQPTEAISEWRKALALKRDLPALHRNLGRALVDFANDPQAAAAVLTEGHELAPDDKEIVEYLSRIHLPAASVRTSAPSPPQPAEESHEDAPAKEEIQGDPASRALIRSVTDPAWAIGQFNPVYFPQEKQPESVRRAYVEVQLQQLLAKARQKRCQEALAGLDNLGQANEQLPFTFAKFSGFIREPHYQYYMGVVESSCGADNAAKKRWSKLSRGGEQTSGPDSVFAYLAAKRLGESDADQRIQAALQEARKANSGDPAALFVQGALLLAGGKRDEGIALLNKLSSSADAYLRYLSLAMLMETPAK